MVLQPLCWGLPVKARTSASVLVRALVFLFVFRGSTTRHLPVAVKLPGPRVCDPQHVRNGGNVWPCDLRPPLRSRGVFAVARLLVNLCGRLLGVAAAAH